jgi:hypothetical protein
MLRSNRRPRRGGPARQAEQPHRARVPRRVARYCSDSLKPSTYQNYADYIDAYVVTTIGKRRLRDVTVPVPNAFYRHLLQSGRRKPDNNTPMHEYCSRGEMSGMDAGRHSEK